MTKKEKNEILKQIETETDTKKIMELVSKLKEKHFRFIVTFDDRVIQCESTKSLREFARDCDKDKEIPDGKQYLDDND